MNMLLQDLRYAVRSLLRRPGFTVAALLTLALGVGATTAIFSVVQAVVLRPLPYDEPEQLVLLGSVNRLTAADNDLGGVSYLNFLDIREHTRSFESLATFTRANATVTGLGDAESVAGAAVSADFFRVLRAEPHMGRAFTEEEDRPGGPHAVIVSHEYWQDRMGGAADVLERSLTISGQPRPIVGVTRPGFEFPRGSRIYLPARADTESCGRGCIYMSGVARLAPGIDGGMANTELSVLASRLEEEYPSSNEHLTFRARSLTAMVVGDMRRTLYVMLGAVFMVLLIACANVANLLLVRGASRAPELAVRSVLGAGRGQLLKQLMTENVLLAVIGGALGVAFASWGVELLRVLAPQDLPRLDEIGLDATAVAFAGGLVLFTALLFGLAPALRLSGSGIADTLRGSGRGASGARQGWGRFAILATEVALAVILLLGAGLMMRSLVRMNAVETGYETSGIAHFTVGLPNAQYDSPEKTLALFDELKQRIGGLAGVQETGLVMPMPLGPSVYGTSFSRSDQPEPTGPGSTALLRVVDGNGLAVLGISVLRGRGFEAADREDAPRIALINRLAAEQFWPGEDPIGKQIDVGVGFGYGEDEPRTIVGVVEDIRAISLTEVPAPEILVPHAQSAPSSMTVVIRARNAGRLISAARAEVRALDPNLALVRPGTMEELVAAQTAASRFFLTLLGIFAALAVTLAAVGIYGVVAFIVARRGREIGVRMALGARIQQVIALVVWQGVAPALAGLAAGLMVALAGGRLLAGLLYEVQPHDPLTIVAVISVLLAVVVLACIVPAGRASRIPPASSLRSE